jgi:hypothetical protein
LVADCFDALIGPVTRRMGRHLARGSPKHLGISVVLPAPEENSELLRGKLEAALDLVAQYGPCELRWLQGGLDMILVRRDSSRYDLVAVTFGGLLRMSPSTVWRLSPQELALRLVYHAARLRFWRAGFDDTRSFKRRITIRCTEYSIAFARCLPSITEDTLRPYTDMLGKWQAWR